MSIGVRYPVETFPLDTFPEIVFQDAVFGPRSSGIGGGILNIEDQGENLAYVTTDAPHGLSGEVTIVLTDTEGNQFDGEYTTNNFPSGDTIAIQTEGQGSVGAGGTWAVI